MKNQNTQMLRAHQDYRFFPETEVGLRHNRNIECVHPAEAASWIWIDDALHKTRFLKFELRFEWLSEEALEIYVTADHRFQLFVDDIPVAYGPDCSSPNDWKVSGLSLPIEKGPCKLTALVWYIAEDPTASRLDPVFAGGTEESVNPPIAQMTFRPGFLLAAHDKRFSDMLDTGKAVWNVAELTDAVQLSKPRNHGYHDIGPSYSFDMELWNKPLESAEAVVVRHGIIQNVHGVRSPGSILNDAILPEQRRVLWSGGAIRALRELKDAEATWEEHADVGGFREKFNRVLRDGAALTIPANTQLELIWDFESYHCGYPRLEWSGGRGSEIEFEWAESLYAEELGKEVHAHSEKGNRAELQGKRWLGFGDRYRPSGGTEAEEPPALWWRSGRYVRLQIKTAEAPLMLRSIGILETGYPYEQGWGYCSSDSRWDETLPLLAQGLLLGAHETWVDCPYYEQCNYVGDTVMHALSNYVGYRDDRLPRTSLINFQTSQLESGVVAERFPSQWRQESGTYAMQYTFMVRDYLLWRGDPDFVRWQLLPGLRAQFEEMLRWLNPEGLIGRVAGWPCVDWVRTHDWFECCGPGMREGDSSILNLHFVLACQAMAWMEGEVGDPSLKTRYESYAEATFDKLWECYWDRERAVLLDTRQSDVISEHAHCLAVLTGLLDDEKLAACKRVLLEETDIARCTVSFSFYLFEAFYRLGMAEELFGRLEWWKALPEQGFTSIPECPEPARSDCHGWGAHPLYHSIATIAGIRPAASEFAKVLIAPMPHDLTHFEATCVHPLGEIKVVASGLMENAVFRICLPKGVSGTLSWDGKKVELDESGEWQEARV